MVPGAGLVEAGRGAGDDAPGDGGKPAGDGRTRGERAGADPGARADGERPADGDGPPGGADGADGAGEAAPRTGSWGPPEAASLSTTSAPSQASVTAMAVPAAHEATPLASRLIINRRISPILPQPNANGVRFVSWPGCSLSRTTRWSGRP